MRASRSPVPTRRIWSTWSWKEPERVQKVGRPWTTTRMPSLSSVPMACSLATRSRRYIEARSEISADRSRSVRKDMPARRLS